MEHFQQASYPPFELIGQPGLGQSRATHVVLLCITQARRGSISCKWCQNCLIFPGFHSTKHCPYNAALYSVCCLCPCACRLGKPTTWDRFPQYFSVSFMEFCTDFLSLPTISHLHLVFPLAHSANHAWGSKYGTQTYDISWTVIQALHFLVCFCAAYSVLFSHAIQY